MSFRLYPSLPRLLSPALAAGLLLAVFAPVPAGAADVSGPAQPADELLREAIAKEKPEFDDSYVAWTDRVQKQSGAVTKLMVTTPEGILSRIVAINDQPLSPEQRRQDDTRIHRLLDPAKMKEKARQQQQDQKHVENLLRVIPDALHCEYSNGRPEDGTVQLECGPNPAFSPPNYESQVLLGTRAEITIDREEKRITHVSGFLFKDVTFGWGFLARLKSGGRFELDQSKVAGKRWELTHLELNFDGHLVMVKPLRIEESRSCWNYHTVPGMTVAQALEYLRNSSAEPASWASR